MLTYWQPNSNWFLSNNEKSITGHIRVRDVRTEALDDSFEFEVNVVQTVSTITTRSGKALVGCEYRVNY